MSEHGNGADGDVIALSVLPGAFLRTRLRSWRFVRAMAAPAIARLAVHDGRQSSGAGLPVRGVAWPGLAGPACAGRGCAPVAGWPATARCQVRRVSA